MINTLANAGDVRNAGGLIKESEGGATDSQINSALYTAQQHLIGLLSRNNYVRVSGYSSSSTEEEQQERTAYKEAESRFALSFLPFILTGAELQSTGFKIESQVGKSTTRYGNEDDILFFSEFWMGKAMLFIAPYLDNPYFDEEEDEYFGFESDEGDFTILVI